MDGATESLLRDGLARGPAAARRRRPTRAGVRPPQPVLRPWLRAQSINVTRHAAALRPFRREEFGTGAAAPSDGHIQAVNTLMSTLRRGLLDLSKGVTEAVQAAQAELTTPRLSEVVRRKDKAQHWVQGIERIWDFYFELFGQRQSNHADWLLSCDRIALDCYQAYWNGLGKARPIPAPPPFCYMRTGFAPATFRRGIPLRRLGRQLNPFPIVQLPYHRLINPWTLGAMLHETSHNLQSELGLSRDIPRTMARTLLAADQPKNVAGIWTRWNREMFADMSALLLGGPEVVGSLMDVVGRAPATVFAFNPIAPHPDALSAHADQRRTAAPHGLRRGSQTLPPRLGRHLSAAARRQHAARIAGNLPHRLQAGGGCDVLPPVPVARRQEPRPGCLLQ